MNKPNNILVIASNHDIAGGENYLLSCFHYLDRDRHNPIVWLPGDGLFREALEQVGIEYVIEPVNYGWLKPPHPWYQFLGGLPDRVRNMVALIKEKDIRLVHTNSNQNLEGALAARLAGIHHLYLAHIEYQDNLPIFQRLPLNPASFAQLMGDLSSGIIAVSEQVREGLCPPLPAKSVDVIHNGIEVEVFDAALERGRTDLRESLGLPDDAILVTAAGRIMEDKGIDLLIEAASTLIPNHPSAVFLICGPTESVEYHERLKRDIEQHKLEKHFLFAGKRNDLPDVLAQSDVFVLSSRREGHPYVLLEAMASKLPTVASDCGGVRETIVEGETGFVVPIGDSEAIAQRLEQLLTSKALRQRMGQLAGASIRAHFTAASTAEGLYQYYDRMLATPPPAPGSYQADLLLQAATEFSWLGQRLTNQEERLKRAERAADLLLENPIMKLLRKFKGRTSGS